MELLGPEDDNCVNINCEYCGIQAHDRYDDIYDLLYGMVDHEGVMIEIKEGRHDIEQEYMYYDIPVNLKVEMEQHFNPLDMIYPEYDVYLILSSRS